MVADDSVVHDMHSSSLIEVRMRVSVGPLAASGPARVGNPAGSDPTFCEDFFDDPVDASTAVVAALIRILDQFSLLPAEGGGVHPRTIIPSVFEQLHALTEKLFSIVSLGFVLLLLRYWFLHDHPNHPAALRLWLLEGGPSESSAPE